MSSYRNRRPAPLELNKQPPVIPSRGPTLNPRAQRFSSVSSASSVYSRSQFDQDDYDESVITPTNVPGFAHSIGSSPYSSASDRSGSLRSARFMQFQDSQETGIYGGNWSPGVNEFANSIGKSDGYHTTYLTSPQNGYEDLITPMIERRIESVLESPRVPTFSYESEFRSRRLDGSPITPSIPQKTYPPIGSGRSVSPELEPKPRDPRPAFPYDKAAKILGIGMEFPIPAPPENFLSASLRKAKNFHLPQRTPRASTPISHSTEDIQEFFQPKPTEKARAPIPENWKVEGGGVDCAGDLKLKPWMPLQIHKVEFTGEEGPKSPVYATEPLNDAPKAEKDSSEIDKYNKNPSTYAKNKKRLRVHFKLDGSMQRTQSSVDLVASSSSRSPGVVRQQNNFVAFGESRKIEVPERCPSAPPAGGPIPSDLIDETCSALFSNLPANENDIFSPTSAEFVISGFISSGESHNSALIICPEWHSRDKAQEVFIEKQRTNEIQKLSGILGDYPPRATCSTAKEDDGYTSSIPSSGSISSSLYAESPLSERFGSFGSFNRFSGHAESLESLHTFSQRPISPESSSHPSIEHPRPSSRPSTKRPESPPCVSYWSDDSDDEDDDVTTGNWRSGVFTQLRRLPSAGTLFKMPVASFRKMASSTSLRSSGGDDHSSISSSKSRPVYPTTTSTATTTTSTTSTAATLRLPAQKTPRAGLLTDAFGKYRDGKNDRRRENLKSKIRVMGDDGKPREGCTDSSAEAAPAVVVDDEKKKKKKGLGGWL